MLFGNARPILPGKLDRVRRLDEELAPHRAAYEALNAGYGIRRHVMWVSHLVDGTDLWVNVYDMDPDDMARMRGRVWDPDGSGYDRWWLEWVQDVFGVDMRSHNGLAGPPEHVFAWHAPGHDEAARA
jgi:hypothetical protein